MEWYLTYLKDLKKVPLAAQEQLEYSDLSLKLKLVWKHLSFQLPLQKSQKKPPRVLDGAET